MIVISTVRSSEEFVSFDVFVVNPRRFNGQFQYYRILLSYSGSLVSVTRAKALLVIIGDPNVPGLDLL